MKNDHKLLDQLVKLARGKDFDWDAENHHYQQLWSELSSDAELTEIFEYARCAVTADMPKDQKMLVVLSRMIVNEMTLRHMAAVIDDERLTGDNGDMLPGVRPNQLLPDAPTLAQLNEMIDCLGDTYEKPD